MQNVEKRQNKGTNQENCQNEELNNYFSKDKRINI